MKDGPFPVVQEFLDEQRAYWEKTFSGRPEMFGPGASEAVQKAAELFRQEGKTRILELGAGQGRDTIFFAQNGFQICALDYAGSGLEAIRGKAQAMGLSPSVAVLYHDIRRPLPFDAESFDACYSHMLYCMALTSRELEFLSEEVRRILKPKGLCIYTVRHTGDPHYRTGVHRGEDMYEVGGFIVHFFDREKVKRLARGYEILEIEEFQEGELPRKLFRVTLRKGETQL